MNERRRLSVGPRLRSPCSDLAVQACYHDFESLARTIAERCDIALPRTPA